MLLHLNEEEMKKSTSYNITGRFNSAVIMKYTEISKVRI